MLAILDSHIFCLGDSGGCPVSGSPRHIPEWKSLDHRSITTATKVHIPPLLSSVILGGVGIPLGLLVLVMHAKPRRYFAGGLPFSLGSESLLFSIVTMYIQGKYVVSPMIYSLFLTIGTIPMVGSTLLLTLELAMSNYPRTVDGDENPRRAGQVL